VHISDIHLGQWITAERLEGIVDLVNRQNPDLVAITGDFVSYIFEDFADELARSLGRLHPRDATVAILGNHDHWVGADNVRRFIKSGNVIELCNDVFTISRGGAMLHIAGLDDIIANKHQLDLVLNKLPSSGPAILMVHEPDFADVSARTGRFCLQLSGHSHGGQIVIPKLGTPIRSYLFRKYPLGRYQVGDMIQYTNRGLGTNLIWSRINCPPEITVFSLRAGEV
jgi:predicted MPP superfamily phosphohydrolase